MANELDRSSPSISSWSSNRVHAVVVFPSPSGNPFLRSVHVFGSFKAPSLPLFSSYFFFFFSLSPTEASLKINGFGFFSVEQSTCYVGTYTHLQLYQPLVRTKTRVKKVFSFSLSFPIQLIRLGIFLFCFAHWTWVCRAIISRFLS